MDICEHCREKITTGFLCCGNCGTKKASAPRTEYGTKVKTINADYADDRELLRGELDFGDEENEE